MSVIEVRGCNRDYGGGKGIFDFDLSVAEGEVFGFLGPNGAGKTTAIRHIMGFIKAQSGSVSVNGLDAWIKRADIQRTLGYIPGEMSFFDDMTGSGFLKFMADYRKVKASGRIKELTERFELNPHGKLKKMSKGMKQKVGIIAAFMHDPAVLVLDEPTSGLDPLMQNRFIDLIQQEQRRGKTILLSSHMFDEIERTCSRVAIIRAGRICATERIGFLESAQLKKYTVTFSSDSAAESFANVFGTQAHACNVTVVIKNNLSEFISQMAKYPVTNISAPVLSLEEVFLQYYGGQGND